MLLFKKKFLDAIRSGEKTQTIRFWPQRRMKPGQRSYIPGVGYISVDAVEQVELSQLADADAQRDGFPDVAALREELAVLYKQRVDGSKTFYRVRFAVLPPELQHK